MCIVLGEMQSIVGRASYLDTSVCTSYNQHQHYSISYCVRVTLFIAGFWLNKHVIMTSVKQKYHMNIIEYSKNFHTCGCRIQQKQCIQLFNSILSEYFRLVVSIEFHYSYVHVLFSKSCLIKT